MKFVYWQAGRKNSASAPLVTVITLLLAHVCCWGTMVFVALGLSGAEFVMDESFGFFKPVFYSLGLAAMGFLWWRTYRKPYISLFDKLGFWISVFLITIMLVHNFLF